MGNWVGILVGIVLSGFLFVMYVRTKNGKYIWDKLKLKVPVVGKILQYILLARFSRTFAINLQSGLSLVKSLTLVSDAVGNEFLRVHIVNMRDKIERGEPLMMAAIESKLFSPLVLQMLSVGEEVGSIDDLLLEVASYYDREVEYDLSRLNEIIEPVIIVILGIMILIIALGVFLPIWNLVGMVR